MATEDFSGTLANWTQWYPVWGTCVISSGQLQFGSGKDTGIRYSAASIAANQYSEADISGVTWIDQYAGVGVRMTGADGTRSGYFARLHDNVPVDKLIELVKYVNGTATTLATTTFATGSSFRLRIEVETSGSNAVLRTFVGATQITALNFTDSSSPLASGAPGLIGNGQTLRADNWAGDEYVAPSVPVLSSPSVVSTGNTIATVRVTTDTAPSGSSTLAVRTRAAAAPAWTAAEVLASPTATLTSGASGARDFNLTGLVNGTALIADFAQTGPSNLVSTASFTPSTVPGAPTIGTATAGNAQATVAGTAPASNGGAAITGYRSTATPGGSTVTGASLPITHTGLTNGTAYTFTLAAQNANGYGAESAASNSVTPSAPGTAPSITVQPSNQTVTAGATATFTAAASGAPTPTVQWQRNGVDISGATSLSYTTPATTVSGGSANNGDVYRAGFTNAISGPVYTSGATLTVSAGGTAPTITVQPSNQTVTAGATATFSVTATGSGLTYQWRRNGTNISGATSSSYTTPATTVSGGSANNGDVYSVVVTGDTAPAATSSNATLTVNEATGPTLPAVATDATGSARRLNQTTRMVVEPFTTIEALGTGTRTIATGTTDPTTGEITLTGLAAGTYAVFGFFPSTGATINGVRFRLVTVT